MKLFLFSWLLVSASVSDASTYKKSLADVCVTMLRSVVGRTSETDVLPVSAAELRLLGEVQAARGRADDFDRMELGWLENKGLVVYRYHRHLNATLGRSVHLTKSGRWILKRYARRR